MKLTLRNLLLLILLAALVPAILISLFSYFQARESTDKIVRINESIWLEDQIQELQKTYAQYYKDIQLLGNLNLFASIPQNQSWTNSRFRRWISETEKEIGAFFISYRSLYGKITLVNKKGIPVFVIEKLNPRLEGLSVFVETEFFSPLDSLFFKSAQHELQQIYQSPLFKGKSGYLMRLFYRIPANSDYFLVLDIKISTLFTELQKKFKSQEQAFLCALSQDGTIIHHGNRQLIGSKYNADSLLMQIGFDSSVDINISISKSIRQMIYQFNNEPILTSTAYLPGYNFVIIKGMPLKQYWDIYSQNLRRNFFVVLLGGIITFLLIRVFSRRIFKAVFQIIGGVEKIAAGDFHYQVSIESGDELQILAVAFNKIQQRLKEMIANVHEMSKQVAEKEKLEELNALKSQFISHVSHELRTPLTAIGWAVDNMLSGVVGNLSNKQEEYLNEMQQTINHITRIIEDLLDLSRIEAGRLELILEDTQVEPLIQEASHIVRSAAQKKKIKINYAYQQDELKSRILRVDADRIVQILKNLLDNAIKYSPENSRIDVLTSCQDQKLYFSIKDKGPGIPEEEQKLIFERFHRSKHVSAKTKGVGLGLSISRELARLHGGEIMVNSKVGSGSTFTLILPMA